MRNNKHKLKTGSYLPMDKVGEYLKEKYEINRLTTHQIDFAIKIAQGFTVYEAYKDSYNCESLEPKNIRSNARILISKPQIQEVIKICKDHFRNDVVIDINSILLRMEEIYDHAKDDSNYRLQLDTLKEMAKVVKDLQGEINVQNNIVRFEINVPTYEKVITTSTGEEKRITQITDPSVIARLLNEQEEDETE